MGTTESIEYKASDLYGGVEAIFASIRKNIGQFREMGHRTTEEVSRLGGYGSDVVLEIEEGRRNPTDHDVINIALFLGNESEMIGIERLLPQRREMTSKEKEYWNAQIEGGDFDKVYGEGAALNLHLLLSALHDLNKAA